MKNFKQSVLNFAVVSALALGGVTSALAGTVGGDVAGINTLVQNDVADLTFVGASGGSAITVVSGTIANNSATGWNLKVVSGNSGKLVKTTGGGAGREILYTNITFVATGGVLGATLTAPSGAQDVTVGAAGVTFGTGAGVATSATTAYAYDLRITWAANTTVLSGRYTDSITLTLADDAS